MTMMLIRSAARTFSTNSTIVSSSPSTKTHVGRLDREVELDDRIARNDQPAIHEADEQDEEADADADRPLQGERHGVHDRLAQADHDQHEDDQCPRGR